MIHSPSDLLYDEDREEEMLWRAVLSFALYYIIFLHGTVGNHPVTHH